jgi:hypothetical protein
MLKKYLLDLIFLLFCFDSILSETYCVIENRENVNTYYVNVGGTNTGSCTSSTENLCGSFEHVMKDLSFPKIVYIQPGNYEYGTTQSISKEFEINGVSECGEDIEDVSAYPAITFSLQATSIRFSSPGYIHRLKILWGNMAISSITSIFYGYFFCFFFYFFYYLFLNVS